MVIPLVERGLLALSVMFVLCTSTPAPGQDSEGDAAALQSYFSANGLLNRGLHELAADEYREFLEHHGDHAKAPVARYGLGVCLYRMKEYEEAVAELSQLHGRAGAPYPAEVATILGQSHLALRNYDEAADCLDVVRREHAGHALADEAAALQAEALYAAGRYDEVQRPCSFLVQQFSDSPLRERTELFWSLADMAQGNHAEAARRLGRMTEMYPHGAYADQTALLLGQALHRSSALQGAIDQYRAVIAQARDEYVPDAMYGLATILHRQKQPEAAGELIDEMLGRFPDDDLARSARLLRGRVHFDLEEYEFAYDLFEEIADAEDELEDAAVYWMAKCELREGDAEAAAERLEEAIEDFPKSELIAEMIYDRAVALSRADEPAGALEQLEQFRARFPEHVLRVDALHLTAAMQHELKRYDDSLGSCNAFLEAHGDSKLAPSIAFLAAENQFLAGEYAAAAETFESFLGRYPDSSQHDRATYRLGMALYRLDRFDEAGPVLERVIAGGNTLAEFRSALLALGDLAFQRGQWAAAESHLADYLAFGLDQPSSDDALLKLGLARHRQGDFENALLVYDVLIDQMEDSEHLLQAVFERGQALIELDRPDEAAAAFTAVAETGGESAFTVHALNHLGAIALQQERYDDAAAYFDRVSAHDADDDMIAEALYQRGQALMSAKRFEEAASALETLIEDHPGSARRSEAQARLAIAQARQDAHEAALATIERVQRQGMDDLEPALRAAVMYEKAWCLRAENMKDEAGEAYRRLLADPVETDLHQHARLELAELEAGAERHAEAAELLRALVAGIDGASDEPDPLHEQALYRLGVCEYELQRYVKAGELLEQFIEAYPRSDVAASASLLCGEAFFKADSHQRAAGHLTRIVQSHREDAETFAPALLRLGECLAVLQYWARSEETFDEYLEQFGDEDLWFQAQFGVAWACENQGRYDDAMGAYRAVTERHSGPTAARAQFQIGECLFAQRRLEDAARELLKVDILYAYPEWSAAALYEAGRCFEELGDPVKARAHFQRVQQEHGETRWAAMAGDRLAQLTQPTLPGR